MVLKQKVRAFTIMEVTVSMLIAAIVIMIVYTAYRIIGRSYVDYDHKNKMVAELIVADKILKKDFNNALDIVKTSDGLKMVVQEGQIDYVFGDQYIVRNQNQLRLDTFKLTDNKVVLKFKNREAGIDQSIDNLSLNCNFEKGNITLTYHKTYSSEQLLQQNEHSNAK
ncbi:MAG: hypothetical protein JWQ25_540 [Daejeonella sp.]|nr:hypothetical protein [Daejeonella sp.]